MRSYALGVGERAGGQTRRAHGQRAGVSMTTQTAQQQSNRALKVKPRPAPDPLAGFEIRGREQVEKALRLHPTLLPLLVEMKAEAERRFPECELLMLAPMRDSPSDLVVRVKTDAADAYERLAQFDDEWARPRWKEINGRLMLTLIVP